MALRESPEKEAERLLELAALRDLYPTFLPFLIDFMVMLGFFVTPVQKLIAQFLEYGPLYRMVQAQRGQAKTTITAAYAIWRLIHDTNLAVLIVSAGGKQANEISTLIVRAFKSWDKLACMCPDASMGDRESVEAFDIHYNLKRLNKSPSVACTGITGNLQGKRAGLLIADDVESQKNSLTAVMRENLLNLTRDFTSICSTGDIIYLGTPQTTESIYNSLPGRGFTVRIWPGRFPNDEQLEAYGDQLCPVFRKKMKERPDLCTGYGIDGKQGCPVDPVILGEDFLNKKEIDQGTAYFQLQHMLQTRLMDALRKPLHLEKLILASLPPRNGQFPLTITRDISLASLRRYSIHQKPLAFGVAGSVSQATAQLQGVCFYIDPAGGGANGDETGFACTGFLNSNIFLLDWGGVKGGWEPAVMKELALRCFEMKPNVIKIEKNFGYGAFREVWLPYIWKIYDDANIPRPSVEDDMVHGQKERRIIDTLEPVIGRGSLIVDESLIRKDEEQTMKYVLQMRVSYSGFLQMVNITYDKDSLGHDDRLDALEGAVRHWQVWLAKDQEKAIAAQKKREFEEWQKDPMMKKRCQSFKEFNANRGKTMFDKRRR